MQNLSHQRCPLKARLQVFDLFTAFVKNYAPLGHSEGGLAPCTNQRSIAWLELLGSSPRRSLSSCHALLKRLPGLPFQGSDDSYLDLLGQWHFKVPSSSTVPFRIESKHWQIGLQNIMRQSASLIPFDSGGCLILAGAPAVCLHFLQTFASVPLPGCSGKARASEGSILQTNVFRSLLMVSVA